MEDRTSKDKSVHQGDSRADFIARLNVLQQATRFRSMKQEAVLVARMYRRDHERSPVHDESDVAEERQVDN